MDSRKNILNDTSMKLHNPVPNPLRTALITSFFFLLAACSASSDSVYQNTGTIYLNKALTCQTDNLALAERSFQIATSKNPANIQAWRGLGIIYLKGSEKKRAEEHFMKLLALSPEDIWGHYYLANAFKKAGMINESKQHLDLAKAWRQLREMHAERGIALLHEGSPVEAEDQFRQLVRVSDKTNETYWMSQGREFLAWSLERQGRVEEATDEYLSAISIGKEQAPGRSAMLHLGRLYSRSGNWEEGMGLINKAISLEPNNRYFLLVAAEAYLLQYENQKALENPQFTDNMPPFKIIP